MTDWRHADRNARDPKRPWLLCVDTPDPTSPCGHGYANVLDCGYPADDGVHGEGNPGWHPHVPTLCKCGHAIEATR